MESTNYRFDSFIFQDGNLTRDGQAVFLARQELQLFEILLRHAVERPTEYVSKKEIHKTLWPHETDTTLLHKYSRSVANKLRDKLGERPDEHPYITKTDYRLNATVVVHVDSETATSSRTLGVLEETASSADGALLEGVKRGASPYPGPQAFLENMVDNFYGRTDECEELLELIENEKNRIIVVHGPSGVGKSSLLNYMIHKKLKGRFQVLHSARPFMTLPNIDEDVEIHNIFTLAAVHSLNLTPHPISTLADCINSIFHKSGARKRLLILDQFEELFTEQSLQKDQASFLADVADALRIDPSLSVILVIRKECLSDLVGLTDKVLDRSLIEDYRLLPMDRANVVEAITLPIKRYAKFEERALDEILEQLQTRGEFLEMVHLQIVCQRLWERLKQGITDIKTEHLHDAAGESKKFSEFVTNALDDFYNDVVRKVAQSPETDANGKYAEELIFFGCMQFVSPELTRNPLPHEGEHVGRLPDWIARQLADEHLLVKRDLGGKLWYELAHDRLVEPVSRRKDRNVTSLLYAADLLDKVLRQARTENGGSLKNYFEAHQEIVSECRPFLEEAGIRKNEMELILRSSLAESLNDAEKWSQKLGKEDSLLRLQVLREALRFNRDQERAEQQERWQQNGQRVHQNQEQQLAEQQHREQERQVRRNAAELLRKDPLDELLPELVRLALNDDNAEVRQVAAESLAGLDASKLHSRRISTLFDEVISKLHDPGSQSRAEAALSRIRIAAYRRGNGPIFRTCFQKVSLLQRIRIRTQAFALQLWEGLPILLCIVIPAGLFAAVSAAFYKLLPSWFGWALTQSEANAGPGFFQGFTAGVIWAGLIVLGLTIYYVVTAREPDSNPARSMAYATAVGAACGFAGSFIIVAVIAAVFNPMVLENMGWVMPGRRRFSWGFLSDLFLTTRYAWAYLIMGAGLGVGMALTIHRLRSARDWNDFKEAQSSPTTFKQAREILGGIIGILNKPRHIWPLPTLLLLTGCLAFFVVHLEQFPITIVNEGSVGGFVPGIVSIRSGRFGLGTGLVGDITTQGVGAYFGIVGMGFGIIICNSGFNLKPRKI